MINKIEIVQGNIPVTETDPKAIWRDEFSVQLYVKITTSDGYEGWGEIFPANFLGTYSELAKYLAEKLIGKDEESIMDNWLYLRNLTFRGGYGITSGTISGFDIALWDIAGKKAKVPLYKLIGGKAKETSRYASLSRYRSEDDIVVVVNGLLSKGFKGIKLHQSGDTTIPAVRKLRDQLGYSFDLMVDINCFFPPPKAVQFAKDISKYEVKWIEEPVWPPDDFRALKEINSILPVAAGENIFSLQEFKKVIEDEVLSFYQPDVTKLGGITSLLKIMTLLELNGFRLSFHNRPYNAWIGPVTSAHLCGAYTGYCLVETPPNGAPSSGLKLDFKLSHETIKPGYEPGIGVRPDMSSNLFSIIHKIENH
jgi:L-alanine-DL-glutamate epimerase-like enolase superfamily enzyme